MKKYLYLVFIALSFASCKKPAPVVVTPQPIDECDTNYVRPFDVPTDWIAQKVKRYNSGIYTALRPAGFTLVKVLSYHINNNTYFELYWDEYRGATGKTHYTQIDWYLCNELFLGNFSNGGEWEVRNNQFYATNLFSDLKRRAQFQGITPKQIWPEL